MNGMVCAQSVSKRIGNKKVLDGLSFSLEAGKILGILGPNGAGKTTLIKLLAGIAHPTAGEISICGLPVGIATKALVSYLPDQSHLHNWLRVKEAIRFYGDHFADFDAECAAQLCTAMGVEQNAMMSSLSKGMAERARMMLTFSRKARLYLLDEPIGGIDPVARNSIIKTLRSSIDENSAIVLSTHQVKDVETLLDEVIFLCDGKAVFSGTADSVREEHGMSIEQWYLEVMRRA